MNKLNSIGFKWVKCMVCELYFSKALKRDRSELLIPGGNQEAAHNKEDVAHIYTMEYYTAIKRNEIELFVVRWMDLESVRSE